MFCSKCGNIISDTNTFCDHCGNKVGTIPAAPVKNEHPKIMLDPNEVVIHKEAKDSSKSLKGQGRTIGTVLMMLSIVFDLTSMFVIGFDAFIPITIVATVIFVIGFFMRMFSV